MEIMEDVVIVGGGIAGLAIALALKKVGVRSLILEKSDRLRSTGSAITLLPNAWLALDALGISHKLTSLYLSLSRQYITDVATGVVQEVLISTTNKRGKVQGPRSVHRKALSEALAEELPADSIRFSSKLVTIEKPDQQTASLVVAHLEDGTTVKSKVLIGCDGVHSGVARWLGLSEPVHSGRSAVRGLSFFPQGHGYNLEVKQFVDAGKRAGLVPLNDTEIYWFFCFPEGQKQNIMKDTEFIQKQVIETYAKNFPSEYLDVVQRADLSTVTWAPLLFRYPWEVIFGKLSKGNVTVAGDAMHPMTPDLSQGGCSALEDAVVLGRHVGFSFIKNRGLVVAEDMTRAIHCYVKERKWRAAGLISGSYLSGWVQQNGSNWCMRFLRDKIFYCLLFSWVLHALQYDCGQLPTPSADEPYMSGKED